jgi:hypothetical protein
LIEDETVKKETGSKTERGEAVEKNGKLKEKRTAPPNESAEKRDCKLKIRQRCIQSFFI